MFSILKINYPPTQIKYDLKEHALGTLFVATTEIGICHISFTDCEQTTLNILKQRFQKTHFQKSLLDNSLLQSNTNSKLHVLGTEFQIYVWKTLISIPIGETRTYQNIAHSIGREKAVRAVGTAIAKNEVALLIPCHRVIRKSGDIGNYRWGIDRKEKLIAIERKPSNLNHY